MMRFVAKRLSTGGTPGAAPSPHTLGALAAGQRLRLTPGVDAEQHIAVVHASFVLAPIDAEASRPRDGDDAMLVARFAVQLLGDAKQSGNPVRRHFLSRDVDLLDAPDLTAWDDDVRAIVLATGTPVEKSDRVRCAPYARDERFDFWPEDWDDVPARAST